MIEGEPVEPSDRLDRDESAAVEPPSLPADGWYRGTIVRLYYGSGTGTLRSEQTGRDYRFAAPFVEIRGPLPRLDALREGMVVGFDLAWTTSGRRVSVIKILE